jgi:hypothetical protein
MEKTISLVNHILALTEEKAKKEVLIEKRREQLETSAKASGDKKFTYYISEKKRNRDKYEALLEKAKADYEKYEAYCDAQMNTDINEDTDKVITGYKFDVKTLTEKIDETEKELEKAQVKSRAFVMERIECERRELAALQASEMRSTYGASYREKPYQPIKEETSEDAPHPAALYLEELEKPIISEDDKEVAKQEYIKKFEDFKVAPTVDPERKQKAKEALEAKKKFEADVKSLLTSDEIEAFDSEYMEGCDKRKIYLMSVEDARKAIQELAPDILKLKKFSENRLNLSSDKDWDAFDMLKKGYQLDVVNRKCNRNERDKLVKRLSKKRD